MLTYLRNPITQGREWSYWPDAKFYYHYRIYRPLSFYVDWPWTSRERWPQYWPSSRSYWHYLNDLPSEKAFRDIRPRTYPQYSPSSKSNPYDLNDFPSEEAYRKIRLYNDLYFDR